MSPALISPTLLIAFCSNRAAYRMILESQDGGVWDQDVESTILAGEFHLQSLEVINCVFSHSWDVQKLNPLNSIKSKNILHGDWAFVTNIVTLNKENVSLSQNYGWHIHSASLNLISLLQTICLKQLRLIRKGCLCCVLLHYQYNSSHKSFTWDQWKTRATSL